MQYLALPIVLLSCVPPARSVVPEAQLGNSLGLPPRSRRPVPPPPPARDSRASAASLDAPGPCPPRPTRPMRLDSMAPEVGALLESMPPAERSRPRVLLLRRSPLLSAGWRWARPGSPCRAVPMPPPVPKVRAVAPPFRRPPPRRRPPPLEPIGPRLSPSASSASASAPSSAKAAAPAPASSSSSSSSKALEKSMPISARL